MITYSFCSLSLDLTMRGRWKSMYHKLVSVFKVISSLVNGELKSGTFESPFTSNPQLK